MEITDVIATLNHKNLSMRTEFFTKAIKCLETLRETNNFITGLQKDDTDRYILESIKLHLTQKFSEIDCFLTKVAPSENYRSGNNKSGSDLLFFREINLTEKQYKNLFLQLKVLSDNDLDAFREVKNFSHPVSKTLYFVVVRKNSDLNKLKLNKADIVIVIDNEPAFLMFFGIETFDFLNHQNLERLVEFTTSSEKHHQKSTSHFVKMMELSNMIASETRARVVLFSGIVLQVLGANYTKDVDIIYYKHQADDMCVRKIEKFAEENEETFDFKFYSDVQNSDPSDNVENTLEIMVDPKQYFYFLGLKFMSVPQLIQRCYMRSVSGSYVDLLMLNRFNNYEIDLCLPNIVNNYGRLIVYDTKQQKNLVDEIVNKMKTWFGISVKHKEVSSLIHRCNNYDHPSMIPDDGVDPLTHYVIKYLVHASKEILYKYVVGDTVLDVDSYRHKNTRIYPKLGVKQVTLLEQSPYLRRHTQLVLDKYSSEFVGTDVNILDLSLDRLSDHLTPKKQYSTVVVRHMLDVDSVLMANHVKVIDTVTTSGSTVIVFMMDGDKVRGLVKNNDYIIKVKGQIKFALFKFDENTSDHSDQKILIYMDRVFAYDKGFLQNIVSIDTVIALFKSHNFDSIDSINMVDVTSSGSKIGFNTDPSFQSEGGSVFDDLKNGMMEDQSKILQLFSVLIFRKKIFF
ncbi:hypothetical protein YASMINEVIRUS_910 [Yasminevirus sp. GU-2018]|uniref:Uncharacterized protein n=1 Tax=Yasminevirus sp. GU-2018 TaxID=2420051 RepID=A0A5K0U938_9VIRU|nr:hypothetical protein YASMINEVIRUS_910 [Yasminevirus sp. GU-2018]